MNTDPLTDPSPGVASPAGTKPVRDVTRRWPAPIEEATPVLVERARDGDEDAATMLFERYHDEIYRYAARRAGDPASGQEVAADTFADAFASLHRYRATRAPFEAWLYTIARRRVADLHRGRARRPLIPLPHDVPGPDHAERTDAAIDLRAAVETLPATERDVIVLRFMEGLDVEQTALRLGKRPGAVRVAQHRGLARLKKKMGGTS